MSRWARWVFLLGSVAFCSIGAIGLWQRRAIERLTLERLEDVAALKEASLNQWMRDRLEATLALAALPELRDRLEVLQGTDESSPEFDRVRTQIEAILRSARVGSDWQAATVLSVDRGQIWVSTDRPRQGEFRNRELYFTRGRQKTFVQHLYFSWATNELTMTVATPLRNPQGETIAVLAVDLDWTGVDRIWRDDAGLEEGTQVYLVDRQGNTIGTEGFGRETFSGSPSEISPEISPERSSPALSKTFSSQGIDAALARKDGRGFYLNGAGIPTLGAYRWVDGWELVLVVEMPRSRVDAPVGQLARTLVWVGLVGLAFGLARSIFSGDRTRVISEMGREEVNLPAKSLDGIVGQLQHLETELAQKVAQLNRGTDRLVGLEAEPEGDPTDPTEDLHVADPRLEQFLQAVPVGIVAIDINRRVSYINLSAQQLLGADVVPGLALDTLLAPDRNTLCIARTQRLYPVEQLPLVRALTGESSTVDDLEIHQDDRIVPVEVWGRPIYDRSRNIAYAIAAFQNITTRQQAKAEQEKFTDEIFQLSQAASRFVPDRFLHLLEKNSIVDVNLGDAVQKEMSILFSDIRDFTRLSEAMTPAENFRFINSYLSSMEPIITEHYGFIDKYIGDAIMALFNRSADDALRAAISMLEKLKIYNRNRSKSGYKPIAIGMGINTGSLILGTVGGTQRMDGTAIGDAVNLASRLESLTKNYGVSLLISHHTFFQLDDATQYAFRAIDRVRVKGKSEWVSVFEVFDADPRQLKDRKLQTKLLFEEGLLLYNKQKFTQSQRKFEECLRQNPEDTVARIYAQRCREQTE